MKKFLLASAILISGMSVASAQDLYFQTADGKELNGETYVFTDEADRYPQGVATEFFLDPDLYIYSPAGGSVTVSMTTNNTYTQLCFGGVCEAGMQVTQTNNMKPGIAMPLLFDYSEIVPDSELANFKVPMIEAVIKAWYTNDPSKVITMTVKMGDTDAAVHSITTDNDKVIVNGKRLDYSVEGSASLSVYSLSGKTLINKQVAGTGHLSLDGFSNGVYLYRLSGRKAKSGKFIIK